MKVSTKQFWKAAFAAQLLRPDEGKRLWEMFRRALPNASKDDAIPLAEWLVRAGALSRFQAKSLLRGNTGPFFVDEYEIVDRVVRGRLQGMYRAIHQPTRRLTALWPAPRLEGESRRAWRAQAERHFPVEEHPHLVRYFHEVKLPEGTAFVVLEDLQGESLAEQLEQTEGRLPLGVACRYGLQAALALGALHERGVVHGAVRSENLWLDRGGALKLFHAPIAWNEKGTVIHETTAAGDLRALGGLLYQWITGSEASADAAPLAEVAPETPAPVCEIVDRLLLSAPGGSLCQAGEIAAALAPFITVSSVEPAAPPASAAAYEAWLSQLTTRVVQSAGLESKPAPAAELQSPQEIPRDPRTLRLPSDAPAWKLDANAKEERSPAIALRMSPALKATLISVGGATCVLVALGLLWLKSRASPTSDPASAVAVVPSPEPEASVEAIPAATKKEERKPEIAAEDRDEVPATDPLLGFDKPMWAPPTSGNPWDMKYLAPGAQLIVAMRPAAIVKQPEGERLIDPLVSGPIGTWWKTSLSKLAGLEPHEIESAIIAICETETGPGIAAVIRPAIKVDEDEWVKGWGEPKLVEEEGRKYYRLGDRAWALAEDRRGPVAVTAPAAELPRMIDAEFAAPAMMSDIERLVAESDSDRMATVIFKPRYVLEERSLWGAEGEPLRKALDAFFVLQGTTGQLEPPKAAMASFHLDENLFVEMKIPNSFGGMTTSALAEIFRNRVRGASSDVLNYLGSKRTSAYANRVLIKFPLMLRELDLQTRYGATRDQALLRAYLPDVAAHNLALATRLSLTEAFDAGQVAAATPTAGKDATPAPATTAALLDKKITVAFDKNTLEQALAMVSQETGLEINVMGADFQAVGITRNGTLKDVAERDKPAREILKTLLQKANPAGLLIYTFQPKESGGDVVQITTRSAAKERNDTIPPEWQEKKDEG